MARSSGSFTSETARQKALIFWQGNQEKIEERNRKLRRIPYHDLEVMAKIKELYQNGKNPCEIAKQFNVSRQTVLRAMRIAKIDRRPPPIRYDPKFEPNVTFGYVLGVLYGDGFCMIRKNGYSDYCIGVNSVDREFVEFFNNQFCRLIGRNEPLKLHLIQTKDSWRQPYYSVRGRSLKLGKFYKNLRLEELASFLKNEAFAIGFLRGFFDSEGCCNLFKHFQKGHVPNRTHPIRIKFSMSNTSEPLLVLVKQTLKFLGIECFNISKQDMPNRWNKLPLYTLVVKGNYLNVWKFISIINVRIKRKRAKIWEWKKLWVAPPYKKTITPILRSK